MSVRYGIDLVLQPSFTAKIYQTRQIVCGQYSSWAAEMQMLRMPLTPYFPCPDDRVPILASQVEGIARGTSDTESYMLRRTGITVVTGTSSVLMEFEAPEPLFELQRKAMENRPEPFRRAASGQCLASRHFAPGIRQFPGGDPERRCTIRRWSGNRTGDDRDGPALEAAADAILIGRRGDDWSNGRWASDLSWQLLSSHPIYAEVA